MGIEFYIALGLQQRREHPQQDQSHAAAVRLGNHAVDAVQRTPRLLFRRLTMAAWPGNLRTLLGKIVFQQLLHRRQPLP